MFGTVVYVLAYFLLYYKYVPRIFAFQFVLVPVVLIIVVCTTLSLRAGTFLVLFLIPVSSSLPYFFGLGGFNPLFFVFYAYVLGFLIHQVRRPGHLKIVNPLFFPILGASIVIMLSALITLWRYTNFFPIFMTSIQEFAVNVLNVSSGEAIRRVLFDSLNYLAGFIWFIILVSVLKTKNTIQKAVFCLAISTVLSFMFGFYQVFKDIELGNTSFFINLDRANALFADPNALGVYIVMTIPVFFGLIFSIKRSLMWVMVLATLSGVFLMPHVGSRSGFFGLILATGFFILFALIPVTDLQKDKLPIVKKRLVFVLFSVVILVFFAYWINVSKRGTLYKRLTKNIGVIFQSNWKDEILPSRQLLWPSALHMIKDFPLSGVGVGSFTCELPNFYKKYNTVRIAPISFYQNTSSHDVIVDSSGNFYLQVASELGLIGLFFFFWIFYGILKQIYRSNFKQKRESGFFYLNAGISSGIMAMFVIFLFGAHTLSFEILLTFWLFVGMLFSFSPARDTSGNIKKFQIITACLFILIFAGMFTWNSFHELSLQSRTEKFELVQEFGFYQVEKMGEQEFKWTEGKAGFSVKVKKPHLVIPLIASHPDIQRNPVEVKIFILGSLFKGKRLLDDIVLKDSSWHEYRHDLSHAIRENILLLFEVNRTWSPSEMLGTSDSRELGIGVGTLMFCDDPFSAPEKEAGSESLVLRRSQSDWKGSQGGNLYVKGQCWIETSLPDGELVFKVSAKGERAKGEWPYMIVWLNDKMIGGEWVTSDAWEFYRFQKQIKRGEYRISVEFINDYYTESPREDRNLFVGDLEILQFE